jgi:hypothetical protein
MRIKMDKAKSIFPNINVPTIKEKIISLKREGFLI